MTFPLVTSRDTLYVAVPSISRSHGKTVEGSGRPDLRSDSAARAVAAP
ncbi:hypothetical protein [Streptomyces sp. NPDC059371]